jgi:hypothetical protein
MVDNNVFPEDKILCSKSKDAGTRKQALEYRFMKKMAHMWIRDEQRLQRIDEGKQIEIVGLAGYLEQSSWKLNSCKLKKMETVGFSPVALPMTLITFNSHKRLC